MTGSDLDRAIEQYHQANSDFGSGRYEPMQQLFSHRDDVTLLDPSGAIQRGWEVEPIIFLPFPLNADGFGAVVQHGHLIVLTPLKPAEPQLYQLPWTHHSSRWPPELWNPC